MSSAKYLFRGRSGYIVHPANGNCAHELIAVGHTAFIEPWSDSEVHLHDASEELYFLLNGELSFWVAGSLLTLRPREILLVRPQVPHAIVGGRGLIEHMGMRAPVRPDKRKVGEIPQRLPAAAERGRELRAEWGFRASLASPEYHNCWLIGQGSAKFAADHLALAYLKFATTEAANAGLGTRHRLHFHERSWEYYCVLAGSKSLQIGNELLTVQAGELLEVAPRVSHTLHSREAPFEGFTFRVPVLLDDKIER
jgi:mannose-6-phosphate isomerase-like protein (cupin superfamily)